MRQKKGCAKGLAIAAILAVTFAVLKRTLEGSMKEDQDKTKEADKNQEEQDGDVFCGEKFNNRKQEKKDQRSECAEYFHREKKKYDRTEEKEGLQRNRTTSQKEAVSNEELLKLFSNGIRGVVIATCDGGESK